MVSNGLRAHLDTDFLVDTLLFLFDLFLELLERCGIGSSAVGF